MKKISLVLAFSIIGFISIGQINADSTYEYLSCELLSIQVKKIDGYSYKPGKNSPIKVECMYRTEQSDTLKLTQDYMLYFFQSNDIGKDKKLNSDNVFNNIYSKDHYYTVGKKYYIKFKGFSLSEIYQNLLDSREKIPCEYHINNHQKFRWRKDKKRVAIKTCKTSDFSFYGIGDIDNVVVKYDVHDVKYPYSSVGGWEETEPRNADSVLNNMEMDPAEKAEWLELYYKNKK
jgi:hypothetical protein